MSEIKQDAPVRVTFEGVMDFGFGNRPGVRVPGGTYLHSHTIANAKSIEVIEPAYEPDALYQDADGDVFYYRPEPGSERPWQQPDLFGEGQRHSDDVPTRPLRKLVPES